MCLLHLLLRITIRVYCRLPLAFHLRYQVYLLQRDGGVLALRPAIQRGDYLLYCVQLGRRLLFQQGS